MRAYKLWLAAVVLCASSAGRAQTPPVPAAPPQMLTMQDAERIALQNHPQIQAAQFAAEAVQQNVTEARSSYYPYSVGSLTAVEADQDSRIAAGSLNNPVIYDRFATGIAVSQLITDFGRTQNLVATSKSNAQAEQENVLSRREDILLQVHQTYYAALRAQSVLKVAQETVKNRQLLADQVTALAQSNLRSSLDVSFANVNLSEAKLLLSQAQNEVQSTVANLSTALGYAAPQNFGLSDEPVPPAPVADLNELVAGALRDRPDLGTRRLRERAAQQFAHAERDLQMPVLSFLGVAGVIPARQENIATLASHYAAAGVNLNIPIFNGHLFSAREAEAKFRDQVESQNVRDLENRITRDVRVAWLNANTGYERVGLTAQLLAQATTALDLAQARYNLGLSSIVELSQAQLQQTSAQIQQASAKYDYQTLISVLNYQVGHIQ